MGRMGRRDGEGSEEQQEWDRGRTKGKRESDERKGVEK